MHHAHASCVSCLIQIDIYIGKESGCLCKAQGEKNLTQCTWRTKRLTFSRNGQLHAHGVTMSLPFKEKILMARLDLIMLIINSCFFQKVIWFHSNWDDLVGLDWLLLAEIKFKICYIGSQIEHNSNCFKEIDATQTLLLACGTARLNILA